MTVIEAGGIRTVVQMGWNLHAAVMASAYLRLILAASGHLITAVPAMMLKAGVRQLPIRSLPVALPANRRPVGVVTLRNRALNPVAQLFIEHTRAVAKAMASA